MDRVGITVDVLFITRKQEFIEVQVWGQVCTEACPLPKELVALVCDYAIELKGFRRCKGKVKTSLWQHSLFERGALCWIARPGVMVFECFRMARYSGFFSPTLFLNHISIYNNYDDSMEDQMRDQKNWCRQFLTAYGTSYDEGFSLKTLLDNQRSRHIWRGSFDDTGFPTLQAKYAFQRYLH